MRPVVLFYTFESSPDASRHAAALALHGYEVRHCPNAAALRLHVRQAVDESAQSSEPVLAVLANATPLNRAAASILAGWPQVGVLAQLEACDDAALVATLQLGIDAWCPRGCSSEVLALALHNLKRRLEHASAGPAAPASGPPSQVESQALHGPASAIGPPLAAEGRWLLREQAWVLETPTGQQLRLTSSERNFMLKLLEQPDKTATHIDLFQRRGQRPADAQVAKRRLGVLVSRLRRKVAGRGDELPLKSLHNWGYMFTGNLAVWGFATPAGSDGRVAPHKARPQEGRRRNTILSR
ncbi:helix-turn-helix domain-containing protein [Pusillimonas sp.]|uniref:helix-turn-helix domain-containing protein n=1 Tax=Pusillimonas sp. TaxID=3040095 RepID=UPI0029BBED65|nr:helix-turn-helix domain-containing protein [Pusillimonas sp.]MDX3893758.1 helix-turn-helix domain-containing protein [Pusillimonas sp.]